MQHVKMHAVIGMPPRGQGTFSDLRSRLGVGPIVRYSVKESVSESSEGDLPPPALGVVDPGPAQMRRRVKRVGKEETGAGSVFAVSLGHRIDLNRILADWPSPDLMHIASHINWVEDDQSQVLHMKLLPEQFDCFILEIGCLVCWGVTRTQLGQIVGTIRDYIEFPQSSVYEDDMVYVPASLRLNPATRHISFVRGDVIYLSTDSLLERLSYSYAFAQSVKLDGYEDQAAKTVAMVKEIPERIVKTGQIGINNVSLSKRIGELYLHRSNLNLNSDILDSPSVLWDLDVVSPVYRLCRKYLDIEKRLNILNQRLDVMKDIYEMVQSEINIKELGRLEMIVVILIVINVFVDIFMDILPFYV
jgi:uncharacterized Rmd1/YagE family protein